MAIKKTPSGWRVDVEPIKGKRYRKIFPTKNEALRFEAFIRSQYATNSKPWGLVKDNRRLSALCGQWFDLHGHALKDGKRRYAALLVIAEALHDPVGSSITGDLFLQYRSRCLASGISAKTLNNHLGYVKAVFNELKALGHIAFDNPLVGVRALKLQERELSWLTHQQVADLLYSIRHGTDNPHVELIVLVCLATGCRWSEAQNLKLDSIRNGAVTFSGTKSGKVRSVPIPLALEVRLIEHLRQWSAMTSSLGAFRRALNRSGIKLPQGQASHVLRHTFASHFVMGGGNVLVLQRILGHSTINMTMRYSHLAKDHFKQAVELSPVRHFFDTQQKTQATET